MQVIYDVNIIFILNEIYLYPNKKRCTSCLQFKTLDGFHKDRNKQDGLCTVCKVCKKDPHVRSFSTKLATSPERKICSKCLIEKSYTDFDKGTKKDGYQSHCKECRKEHNRQFRLENIEKFREYDRSRVGDTKRNEQWKQRYHEVYSQNPRYMNQKRKTKRNWYHSNPWKTYESTHRRNARKRKTTVGKVDFKHILKRDGYFCYICCETIDPKDLCFDHVIPLRPRLGEQQGTHTEDNIRPTHRICNSRKSNKPLDKLTPFDRRGLQQQIA